jgi:hypothetical protein
MPISSVDGAGAKDVAFALFGGKTGLRLQSFFVSGLHLPFSIAFWAVPFAVSLQSSCPLRLSPNVPLNGDSRAEESSTRLHLIHFL